MQVMDIVNRAAMNCGVASSFNLGEVPEDIQARGSDLLRNEIIPTLNCDRSVDITEIIYKATPKNGVIELKTPPPTYPNFIIGKTDYTFKELIEPTETTYYGDTFYIYWNCIRALKALGYLDTGTTGQELSEFTLDTSKLPMTQLGEIIPFYIWTSDNILAPVIDITGYDIAEMEELWYSHIDSQYNIPFNPMRIQAIVRTSDGAELQHLHAEEFISAEYMNSPLCYYVEDEPNRVLIKFNKNFNDNVSIVLPVPITVVNSFDQPNPYMGTIDAPEKFKSFLISKLAYRLAVEYGLDTAGMMKQLADEAYLTIIKNMSKRPHTQDIARKITDYLGRGVRMGGGIYGGI